MAKTIEEIIEQSEKKDQPNQSKAHSDLVVELREKFIDAKNAKADIEKEMAEAREEYENIIQASTDGLANINNPILFSVVQTKVAEELSSMPQIQFSPQRQEDVPAVEQIKSAYYFSTTRGEFNFNVYKCFVSKDMLGTGIAAEEYSYKKRIVRDLVPDKKGGFKRDDKGELLVKERQIIDEDDLVLRYVDVRRFFPDPEATSMEEAAWCFETEEVDFDAFLMYASHNDIYIKENLDLVRSDKNYNYRYPFGLTHLNKEEKQKGAGTMASKSGRVLLVKYFNKIHDRYVIIANGIVVRDTPIPYSHKKLPYIRFVNHMELDSFWGRSEYRVIKQLIEEKNNFRNMMTDWGKINLNRPILMGHTDFEDEDNHFGPGEIWEVGDINQIKLLDLGDIPSGIFGLEGKMDEDVVAFTGVDVRALISSGDETATKSAIKNEKALKRIGMGLRVVDWTALEPFAKMRLANIQQFYSQKRIEMITEPTGETKPVTKYRTIKVPDKEVIREGDGTLRFVDRKGTYGFFEASPEVIRAQVDVEAITGSTLSASKEVDRQNFNNTLQAIAAFPEIRAQLNWRNIAETLAKKNNEDPTKFLNVAPQEGGGEAIESDIPTEQLLREQGIPAPGEGAGGPSGDIAPDVPSDELIAQLFNTQSPNAETIQEPIPGGPQPAAK